MGGATSSSNPTGRVQTGQAKVALVTGAARRIGEGIAEALHWRGLKIAVHCHRSKNSAEALAERLNAARPDSAAVVRADLGNVAQTAALPEAIVERWGRLDVLVNNASTFHPTPLGEVSEAQWQGLMDSNLKGPFFLSQAAAAYLAESDGAAIVNIGDIHARRPLREHAVYCAAKAGLLMLTESLAKDLAPAVRVNAVCPGTILWPEPEPTDAHKQKILRKVALGRQGEVRDIADAVCFLALDAPYVTGQVLSVDGGRSLSM